MMGLVWAMILSGGIHAAEATPTRWLVVDRIEVGGDDKCWKNVRVVLEFPDFSLSYPSKQYTVDISESLPKERLPLPVPDGQKFSLAVLPDPKKCRDRPPMALLLKSPDDVPRVGNSTVVRAHNGSGNAWAKVTLTVVEAE